MTRICSLRVMVSHKQFGIFCFTLIQFLFMYVGYISDSDGRTTFCNVIKLCSNHIISQRGFIPKGLMAPFYQKKEEMSYLIVYDRFLVGNLDFIFSRLVPELLSLFSRMFSALDIKLITLLKNTMSDRTSPKC